MKMIVIIMTTCLLQVSAASFAQKVTLVRKNIALSTLFAEITRQTGYEMLYSSQVDKSIKLDVNFNGTPLKEVLENSLEKQGLTFTIEDKIIVVKPKEPTFLERLAERWADTDIRGVVRNERGEPLEGITVMVKGAKTGTRTNAKGEFVLKGVKKGDVLVFTGVAIEPFEYTVKDDKNIDLNLKARLVQLEEVGINTGYQKISKERFVGSYSQLDSAAFHRRAGMGILERLDGTVTGVLFDKKGNGTNPIQIRGISTLGMQQTSFKPLIILDNFPYNQDLSTINPNDVESVTVLKDAAAASIWGARAGNGVIVITTKKGKYNQDFQVSVSSNVGLTDRPNLYYFPQIDNTSYIELEKYLYSKGYYNSILNNTGSRPPITPVVEILKDLEDGKIGENQATASIDELAKVDLREQQNKYVYRNAIQQQHYLNFRGGSEKISYNFSFGFNRNLNNILGSKPDDQFTLNTSTAFKPLKNLEIQSGLNLSQSDTRSSSIALPFSYPYLRLVDMEGNFLPASNNRDRYLDTVGSGQLLDWKYRPLEEIRLNDTKNIVRTINLNIGGKYAIFNWLSAQVNSQISLSSGTNRDHRSQQTYYTRDLINQFTNLNEMEPSLRFPVPKGGILNVSNTQNASYAVRGQFNINKDWRLHSINGMVGAEISESSGHSNGDVFYGYDNITGSYSVNLDYSRPYPKYDGNGNSENIGSGSFYRQGTLNKFISLIANLSYAYKEKYTFYASARRDGSNVFGVDVNNKWKPLWSLGGSWDIHKETFFTSTFVNTLRVRSSYGYSGNVNNTLSGLTTIEYQQQTAPYTNLYRARLGSAPNPNLRWEQVATINLGVDFGIFNNRISGSFEWFHKHATDLISLFPFPPSHGVDLFPVNSASLKGNGFDLTFNTKNTIGEIRWNSNFGLSNAKMIVTKLYRPELFRTSDFLNYSLNPAVGKVAYGISSYRWAGLDPGTGDPRGYLNGQISKDYSAIALDSIKNQIFHGSALPLYSGFLGNSVSYKNLTLSANISFRFNFYFRKPTFIFSESQLQPTVHSDYLRRWKSPGDELKTSVPSLTYPLTPEVAQRDFFYKDSEITVSRGDNIRLNDIKLAYTFNSKNKMTVPIRNFTLFIYANSLNILIWKREKSDVDPDFKYGQIPPSKSWTFGCTINL